jgi:hypothetical protein
MSGASSVFQMDSAAQHWIENGVPDNRLRDDSPMGSTTFTIAINGER